MIITSPPEVSKILKTSLVYYKAGNWNLRDGKRKNRPFPLAQKCIFGNPKGFLWRGNPFPSPCMHFLWRRSASWATRRASSGADAHFRPRTPTSSRTEMPFPREDRPYRWPIHATAPTPHFHTMTRLQSPSPSHSHPGSSRTTRSR